MKIAAIETFDLACPLEQPFGWSQGWLDQRSTTLVKVTTDDGLVGWGEGAAASLIDGLLAPLLIGQDPMDRAGLWERMFHALYNGNNAVGLAGSALSALDIALWDLAGKATGLPIYALLGGKVRDKVAVYATGLYYTKGEFPDRLLDEARGYVDAGFKGMKTKVGGLAIAEDVARVRALRDAIGLNTHLMIDANEAYNATTAIRIGRQLADLDLVWFEEPVNAQDLDAYLEVKAALPMAIAGGENLRTRYEFKPYLTRRAYDIVQPDIMHCGGITEMQRICAMANACGIQVNPHVWGSPVMIAATLHLAATLPPCPPARNAQPYMQEPVMEFDRTPSAIRQELCAVPFDQEDSFVRVPTGPGLGIEVDEGVVERLRAS
ncbi:MAG: mandelate racemase/muconate lactonizing enzyme family protein [Gemmatimonadetes bacterium]|nr:mandelate racemase/muconate lactonizing enzyme family protein [Gemmatimonadota bacterium]MYK39746.1 mandelate racemase/muconate lactonizing enzyme family protein [Gemmatimonadota bacterium]